MISRIRRLLPLGAAVAVLTGLCAPVPAVAAPAPRTAPARPASTRLAPDRPAPGHDLRPAPPVRRSTDVATAARRAIPTAATATLAAGTRTIVGGLPVTVGAKATVAVLDQATATRARVAGVLLRVTPARPARLTVSYGQFRDAYGGDWATRLRLWRLPDCALSTPDTRGCAPTPVAARNDTAAGTLTADSVSPGVLAVAAGASGPAGDYTATSLGAAGNWQVGESSGSFNWSYPLRLPPVPHGLVPGLGLSYGSGGVDGRTSSQNGQPSWVGEGWDLWPGFVERRYRTCSDDGTTRRTPDLCWGPDNLTLSLNGHTDTLVRDDTTHGWHLRNDDGSTVEQVSNMVNGTSRHEAFKVTTQDGTQYLFGSEQLPGWANATDPTPTGSTWTVPVFGNDSGEPCPAGCVQGYRWNLDYVQDRHGNAIGYYYKKQTNRYGPAGAEYVRGGMLWHVDYGFQDGHAYDSTGPARPAAAVFLETASRCDPAVDGCTSFPDTPRDQTCAVAAGSACTAAQAGPTFWSDQMLTRITTKVLRPAGYTPVDRWDLAHIFPTPGDGQPAALWLDSIIHTGLVGGSIALPPTTFKPIPLQNRVDNMRFPGQKKMRITEIHTEFGGTIGVNYAAQECSPSHLPAAADTDTMRCFAQWWSPPGEGPRQDWFHKYVVDSVTESDLLQAGDPAGGSPPRQTHYAYQGDPAWHFDDADEITPAAKRTWSDWRGYGQVTLITGAPGEQSEVVDTFYRGMDGDHLPSAAPRRATVTDSTGTAVADLDGLAGQVREHVVHNGPDGAEVTGSISTPFRSGATAGHTHVPADGITVSAYLVRPGTDAGRTDRDGHREPSRTLTARGYDSAGRLTSVDDQGDRSTAADDTCTRTEYITDTDRHILTLPFRSTTTGRSCAGGDPVYPADGVSQTRTYYDSSSTLGELPTNGKGNPTRVETAKAFNAGGASAFVTTSATFDAVGRPLTTTDAMQRITTYAYTGSPMTQSTVTTPPAGPAGAGLTTVNAVDPAWGTPLSTQDPNGNVTTRAYDALGRITGVWLPDHPRDTPTTTPSTGFGYQVSNTSASWQRTDQTSPLGSVRTSYTLYDGLARARQTQTPTEGGRLVSDTFFDTRGHPVRTYNSTFAGGDPTGTVFITTADNVLSETDTTFDGADRATAVQAVSAEQPLWESVTGYGGDRVDVTPPAGGTPTTSYVDATGKTTELRQYHGSAPTGDHDSTTYTYTRLGQLDTVTAPGGAAWHYTYDVLGRNTSTGTPDAGTSTTDYDDSGAVTRTTDARGRVVAYGYDGMGRRTGAFDGSLTGPQLSKWAYDTAPGPTGAPTLGQPGGSTRYVSGATGPAYTETVTGYDRNGRSTGESVTVPDTEDGLAGTYSFSRSYAANGSLNTVSYPAAGGLPKETVRLGYDQAGLPVTLKGASTYVTGSDYDSSGNPEKYSLSTGSGKLVSLLYTYDRGTGRLLNETVARDTTTDPHPADITYSYDDAGNLTSASDTGDGHAADTQCYRYDRLRRLSEAWTPGNGDCAPDPAASALGGPAPYWQSYSYDAGGNRTRLVQHGTAGDTTATYAYPVAPAAQPHTLRSVTTAGPGGTRTDSFGYDAGGDTTSRPGPAGAQTLDWDAQGNLAAATTGTGTTTYRYDASGTRLIERDPAGATLYLPDGMELHWSAATRSSTATRYYSHNGTPVAMRTSAGVTWLAADPHGTVSATLNPATAAITSRRSDPFGNIRGTAPTPWDSHGFLNAPIDPGTGLTHLGARDYDPTLGRFMSADPVADPQNPQQLNGYAYADNNPTTSSDPSGLLKDWDDHGDGGKEWAGGGAGGGAGGSAGSGGGKSWAPQRTTTGPTRHAAPPAHANHATGWIYDLLVQSGNPEFDRLLWEALLRIWHDAGAFPRVIEQLFRALPDMEPDALGDSMHPCRNAALCNDPLAAGLGATAAPDMQPGKQFGRGRSKQWPWMGQGSPDTRVALGCWNDMYRFKECAGISHDDRGNWALNLAFGRVFAGTYVGPSILIYDVEGESADFHAALAAMHCGQHACQMERFDSNGHRYIAIHKIGGGTDISGLGTVSVPLVVDPGLGVSALNFGVHKVFPWLP
jgi:RHS repeat-associated protein